MKDDSFLVKTVVPVLAALLLAVAGEIDSKIMEKLSKIRFVRNIPILQIFLSYLLTGLIFVLILSIGTFIAAQIFPVQLLTNTHIIR